MLPHVCNFALYIFYSCPAVMSRCWRNTWHWNSRSVRVGRLTFVPLSVNCSCVCPSCSQSLTFAVPCCWRTTLLMSRRYCTVTVCVTVPHMLLNEGCYRDLARPAAVWQQHSWLYVLLLFCLFLCVFKKISVRPIISRSDRSLLKGW